MSSERQTFSISEAAEAVGLSTRTLHRYEAEGLIRPGRVGRWRCYTPADIAHLRVLAEQKLLKMRGASRRNLTLTTGRLTDDNDDSRI